MLTLIAQVLLLGAWIKDVVNSEKCILMDFKCVLWLTTVNRFVLLVCL